MNNRCVCSNCGSSMEASDLFCTYCGHKAAQATPGKVCPACGAANEVDVAFCTTCGMRFQAADEQPVPNQPAVPVQSVPVQPAAPVQPEAPVPYVEAVPAAPGHEMAPQGKLCPACGCLNENDTAFCIGCGAKFADAPMQAMPAVQTAPEPPAPRENRPAAPAAIPAVMPLAPVARQPKRAEKPVKPVKEKIVKEKPVKPAQTKPAKQAPAPAAVAEPKAAPDFWDDWGFGMEATETEQGKSAGAQQTPSWDSLDFVPPSIPQAAPATSKRRKNRALPIIIGVAAGVVIIIVLLVLFLPWGKDGKPDEALTELPVKVEQDADVEATAVVTVSPTPYPTATMTPVPTAAATFTPRPTATMTPVPTATATSTPRPAPTFTPVPKPEDVYNNWLPEPEKTMLPREQMIDVYSGPETYYYQGANGNAEISTNMPFHLHGREGDWYMISYGLTKGGYRVGYINKYSFSGVLDAPELDFDFTPMHVLERVRLKDDHRGPEADVENTPVWIEYGTWVSYLATVEGYNGTSWYYIECYANGKIIRGFIPATTAVSVY